jgi:hypothetical protein
MSCSHVRHGFPVFVLLCPLITSLPLPIPLLAPIHSPFLPHTFSVPPSPFTFHRSPHILFSGIPPHPPTLLPPPPSTLPIPHPSHVFSLIYIFPSQPLAVALRIECCIEFCIFTLHMQWCIVVLRNYWFEVVVRFFWRFLVAPLLVRCRIASLVAHCRTAQLVAHCRTAHLMAHCRTA